MMKRIMVLLAACGIVIFGAGCSSPKPVAVDWKQFRTKKSELTAEQAVGIVRSSVALMGRQMMKKTSNMGSKFVLERVDPRGFAFNMEMTRTVGNMTMVAAMPTTEVNFGDVTTLNIIKTRTGKETGVALMAGNKQLWELPFPNANERDRLLLALTVLCRQLVMGEAGTSR